MQRERGMRILVILVITLAFMVPLKASGDNTDRQARNLFNDAVHYYKVRRFADALHAFKKAYSIRPSYRILFNIGQTHAEMGSPSKAMEAFEGYLAEGAEAISKKRRDMVENEIALLRRIVGELFIEGPEGAEVWINGERREHLPLSAPLLLPAGRHTLIVRKSAGLSCQKKIRIVGGRTTSESCDPTADTESPDFPGNSWQQIEQTSFADMPTLEKPERTKHRFMSQVAPWIVTGLGVTALTSGIICASKTAKLNNTLNGNCAKGGCPPEYRDDVDRLPKLATATDVLFIAGAALSVGAVLLFAAPWQSDEKFENSRLSAKAGDSR